MRNDLIEAIEHYKPFNEQEENDKKIILKMLRTQDDVFERTNEIAHMTASAWVLNKEHTKALMIYHNIYNSWSWMGGHADGDEDLMAVAVREVHEESGIQNVVPIYSDIFSLETLTVDGHEKHGKYVSSHLHLNVTYLLEADDKEDIRVKADENSGVAWYDIDESVQKSSEIWFKQRIYRKLNQKLKQIFHASDNRQAKRLYDSIEKNINKETAEKITSRLPLSKSAGYQKKFEWAESMCADLEKEFDDDTVRKIRMDCACGPSASALAKLKKLYKASVDLRDFVCRVNELDLGFTFRYEDNSLILIYPTCYCPCVKRVDKPISKTWCYCTVGYTRRTFEYILDRSVAVELIDSVKMSGRECVIKISF